MPLSDQKLIAICKQEIQAQLFPAKQNEKLRQRDFEYLLEAIQKKSGIKMSLSTLKRIWREDYKQTPHPTTLNALVAVIDYKDWRAFQSAKTKPLKQKHATVTQSTIKHYWPFLFGAVAVIISIIVFSSAIDLDKSNGGQKKRIILSDKITFTANKTVTSGLPNSVIFHYDLHESQADSFFIQKSWNPTNKTRIDPSNHYLSEIYYAPGFHWARLLANDSIIKWVPVHILTDGWFAAAKYDHYDEIPMYLDQKKLLQNGALSISRENFAQSKVNLDRAIQLRYYNIRTFEGIDAQNFNLETKVKCEKINHPICPFIEVMLVTEQDIYYLSLTSNGCISNLALKFGEKIISGKRNDLSALGADVYEWQEIEWKTKNKEVEILVNGKTVFTTSFQFDHGQILGVIYTFSGPGIVDYFRLKNKNGQTVYADEFETTLTSINQ